LDLFHPNGSSPIQRYIKRKEKKKKWLYQEKKRKREGKGEQKEVKQILNETLFKDPCLKQHSHNLFGALLSFTLIPLALATIQA